MVTTIMTASDVASLAARILPLVVDLKITGKTVPMEGWGDIVDIFSDGTQHSVMRFDTAKEKKLIRAITEAEVE